MIERMSISGLRFVINPGDNSGEKRMRLSLVVFTSILLASFGVSIEAGDSGAALDARGAFDRLKSLAGNWEARAGNGTSHLTYEVIAGGSPLV